MDWRRTQKAIILGGFLYLDVQENATYVIKDSGFPFRAKLQIFVETFGA